MKENKAAPKGAEKKVSKAHFATTNIRPPSKLEAAFSVFLEKGNQQIQRKVRNGVTV
ncbi:MAG: hypothetical protein H7A00_03310 [Hahellaceae bacterium]|nr:hypothetical protein [Hahellaceae bacterium]